MAELSKCLVGDADAEQLALILAVQYMVFWGYLGRVLLGHKPAATKDKSRRKTELIIMMATSSGARKPVLPSLQFTKTSSQLASLGL